MKSRLIVIILLFPPFFSLLLTDPLSAQEKKPPAKLPISKLAPAKMIPNLCLVKYRISTTSPACQAYFDQGLGYLYSYMWMEATRSFETATYYDPDCPMGWWALSRALERYRKKDFKKALSKAQDLLDQASPREQMIITARLQEKGLIPELKDKEARVKAATKTLDEVLAMFEDDEEVWFLRGMIACNHRIHGGNVNAVPFYKALVRINPLHPGANHELVHFYEGFRRPALGWSHAENYLKSSPRIPHAWHMQAHLAMRLGKWDKTTDRSVKAVELEREYHKIQGVKPREDYQFSHHLEILTISLIHDGRFREAHQIMKESQKHRYTHRTAWFKLHMAERDFEAAWKVAEKYPKNAKFPTRSYYKALVHLAKGELDQAKKEKEILQKALEKNTKNKKLEVFCWHVDAILKCRQGEVDEGLQLFKKLADWSANDFRSHSWGGGGYFMESWGEEALRANRLEQAEEAFLEAVAHDPGGSVCGALGMQIICELQGRTEEASRFAELAQRCWSHADPGCLEAKLAALRELQTAGVSPK